MLSSGLLYTLMSISLASIFPILAGVHNEWAHKDLVFVRDAIVANHPGMYNAEDPNFSIHLEQFFQDAHQALQYTKSDVECKVVLQEFGKRFDDTHVSISFSEQQMVQATDLVIQSDEPFSCAEGASGVLWVRIPLFMVREEDKAAMESIITSVLQARAYPYIVFDLRGNRGGSSMWGEQIANSLFGESYAAAKRAQAQANQYVEWRASADNMHYWCTEAIPYINTTFGTESEAAQWALAVKEGMKRAYDTGEIYYREESKYKDTDVCEAESLYAGTIVAVIDRFCGSACLDFIDELKLLSSRIVLVGQQTSTDSVYMEVRIIPLPSGNGVLSLPIKVYRNRPRGHNVPYVPDMPYAGDMNDTKAIQEWMLQMK